MKMHTALIACVSIILLAGTASVLALDPPAPMNPTEKLTVTPEAEGRYTIAYPNGDVYARAVARPSEAPEELLVYQQNANDQTGGFEFSELFTPPKAGVKSKLTLKQSEVLRLRFQTAVAVSFPFNTGSVQNPVIRVTLAGVLHFTYKAGTVTYSTKSVTRTLAMFTGADIVLTADHQNLAGRFGTNAANVLLMLVNMKIFMDMHG